MICPDGEPCTYWFTADGHCVCRHGLNEKNFADKTSVELCCPLELQTQHETEKMTEFCDWLHKGGLVEIMKKLLEVKGAP